MGYKACFYHLQDHVIFLYILQLHRRVLLQNHTQSPFKSSFEFFNLDLETPEREIV